MVTLTLDLDDTTYQDIENDAKQNNMKLSDFIISLIKSKKSTHKTDVDFSDIDELGGSLAQYAKDKPILTNEETDELLRQKFAKKWVANESH